ncbi:hypothetical protein [Kitasatospora azatica]|uniref:hypothetical protein n=1 Tax=Kitasatospora azatica TaxID=58347 RepID=UPI00056086D9|nr:hypothetical protein [Kitasatospora azatica]
MSKVTDLRRARQTIQQAIQQAVHQAQQADRPADRPAVPVIAVQQALAVGSPVGDPAAIRERARAYARAAAAHDRAGAELGDLARDRLPDSWSGSVAEQAAGSVRAVAEALTATRDALADAARLLDRWADDLAWAQRTDAQGCARLRAAALAQPGNREALTHAANGVAARLAAATRAESSGTSTAVRLDELSARAHDLASDSTSRQPDPQTAEDAGAILTDRQLDRAAQVFAGLNGSDQAEFSALLSNVASPEEAAYLWKALAAGHPLADIQRFDATIRRHGTDPAWLTRHLMPPLGTGQAPAPESCCGDDVPVSTLLALARLDPLLMLSLTTGGSFDQRVQQLCSGGEAFGEQGAARHPEEDRRAALRRIEAAVDDGLPVCLQQADTPQLLIIGRDGDRLEVYHPEGFTSWMPQEQFINGQYTYALEQPK